VDHFPAWFANLSMILVRELPPGRPAGIDLSHAARDPKRSPESDRFGPRFERPLRDEGDIEQLRVPDPTAELRYVLDAVSESLKAISLLLIPWAI